MAAFASWVGAPSSGPKIMAVTGPGGIGKSTLLKAMSRELAARGQVAAMVDGRVIDASPSGLAGALGAETPRAAIDLLSSRRAVLLLDSFEHLRPLTHFLLEEFFPALARDVPIVIASRDDVTVLWRPWRHLASTLPLGGLSKSDSKELLLRRGVEESEQVERVVNVTKGHPLSLSLAADIVQQSGMRPLGDLPEWRLAARSLVEDLLSHVEEPGLRLLLEASAVLRQFDEPTLAEMSPGVDVSGAFARLCELSIVRPGPRGLMLHDEVRNVVREDLRWRNPERYQALRTFALARYRRLAKDRSSSDVNAWVFTEAAYLSEDPFVHLGMFSSDNPSELWTEPARSADRQRLLHMQASFASELHQRRERPAPEELDPAFLEAVLGLDEARILIAWSRTHGSVGYGLMLPIQSDVLAVLPEDGAIARLIRRALPQDSLDTPGLPRSPGDAWFLGTIVALAEQQEEIVSALSQEAARLFAEPRIVSVQIPVQAG
jgi:energy-coupling factor transporter ATP-binding protein EcfA2